MAVADPLEVAETYPISTNTTLSFDGNLSLVQPGHLREPWLDENTVFAHFLPDRHLNGEGVMDLERWEQPVRVGGDLAGATGDVGRQAMFATAVWMGPIAKNPPDDKVYHFYHPIERADRIDPQLGSAVHALAYTTEVHNRGMRAITDVVPNHVSDQHPKYLKAIGQMSLEEGESIDECRNWFIFDKKTGKAKTFLGCGNLIKLNCDTPAVVEYLQEGMEGLIELGWDGFRADHLIGLTNNQIRSIFGPLKRKYPGMALIGEAWFGADGCEVKWKDLHTLGVPKKRTIWALGKLGLDELSSTLLYNNYVGLLDGVLDFTAAKKLKEYALAESPGEKERAQRRLLKWTNKFRGKLLQVVAPDNHDVRRFMRECGDDPEKFLDALELLFSLQNPIAVYSGTEYGASQVGEIGDKPYGDTIVRKPTPLMQQEEIPGVFERVVGMFQGRMQRVGSVARKAAEQQTY